MVNLSVLKLLISKHIKNKGIYNLFSKLGFYKMTFIKCFEINKLKNLKLTILRFCPDPGSYLYYFPKSKSGMAKHKNGKKNI